MFYRMKKNRLNIHFYVGNNYSVKFLFSLPSPFQLLHGINFLQTYEHIKIGSNWTIDVLHWVDTTRVELKLSKVLCELGTICLLSSTVNVKRPPCWISQRLRCLWLEVAAVGCWMGRWRSSPKGVAHVSLVGLHSPVPIIISCVSLSALGVSLLSLADPTWALWVVLQGEYSTNGCARISLSYDTLFN
jgi:hypothetical protein